MAVVAAPVQLIHELTKASEVLLFDVVNIITSKKEKLVIN